MPIDEDDEPLLKILALSPVREKLESLRFMLDWALGTPEQTPDEELCEAAKILHKHVESGYIKEYEYGDDGHLVWHPMAYDENA